MDRGRYPRDERDDDRAYDDDGYGAAGGYETPYTDEPAYDDDEAGAYDGAPYYGDAADDGRFALAPLDASAALPALASDVDPVAPVIIRGTGVSMGTPFIRRRERPLTMRLAVITLTICILVTGLFAITPLGSSADSNLSSFQALSGAVVLSKTVSFHWYVAQAGDTLEGIAASQHVEIGGIYELNGLLAGQDITVGKAYKIPDDPFYGKNFRPQSLVVGGSGKTVLGNSPWTSIAGDPLPFALCGPTGNGYAPAYQLVSPNPGSHWVRGFTWYHNGVDIAANYGNPIRAAQAGEVIWSGWDYYGLGYSVKINNCNHIATVYGHMSQLLVKAGDNVTAGQIIGLEGSTGNSTGPHLHFMVEWDNNPVDPMAYYNYSICSVTGYC
jgi:LysM repeat protein